MVLDSTTNCVNVVICEAEYVSLATATQQGIYLMQLAKTAGLDLEQNSVTIFEDNQSCIALTKDWIFRKKTKHMDVRYHFIRHHVLQGEVKVKYCPTELMVADILTKPLSKVKFNKFKKVLCGQDNEHNNKFDIEGGC